jgi:hypothetical protein
MYSYDGLLKIALGLVAVWWAVSFFFFHRQLKKKVTHRSSLPELESLGSAFTAVGLLFCVFGTAGLFFPNEVGNMTGFLRVGVPFFFGGITILVLLALAERRRNTR